MSGGKKKAVKMNKQELLKAIESKKTISTWDKAISLYAYELIEDVEQEEITMEDIKNGLLLNGADDWGQFSYGGCSLCADYDIAKRLCTPSAFKKSKEGQYNPNKYENWLDCQTRALRQAERRIKIILYK